MMKKIYLSLFWVLAATFGLSAQVYVKHDAAGANNGTSWANAYTSLETALSSTSTGAVWVAAGTYRLSSNTASFIVDSGLLLYGGFNGTETSVSQRNPAVNVTILSGDVSGNDVAGDFATGRADNAAHVVVVNGTTPGTAALVSGFTISGGNAAGTGAAFNTSGGGVFAYGRVLMRGCSLVDNFATTGTAIYLATTADDTEIKDCNISNNYGQAALYMRTVDGVQVDSCDFTSNLNEIGNTSAAALLAFNCQNLSLANSAFVSNKAPYAGALYCLTDSLPSITNADNFVISNCSFLNNQNTYSTSTGNGLGGAARFRNCSYSLIDCIFESNSSVSSGGHIRNDVEAADNLMYENCIFKKGDSGGWGGACTMYGGTALVKNCQFEENVCAQLGGAAHNGFVGNITYEDCTFLNNKSEGTGSGGALGMQNDQTTVNAINCNFTGNNTTGNGGAIFSGTAGSSNHINLENCVFEGNVAAGTGGAVQTGDNGPSQNGTLNATNCIFNFNTGAQQAGAINISNVNTVITSCLFTNNIATSGSDMPTGRGGAISLNVDSTTLDVTIMNSTFAYNAGEFAAAISAWVDTTFTAELNTVLQNNIFVSDGLANYGIEQGSPVVTSNGGNLYDDESLEAYMTHPKDIKADDTDGLFVDANDDNYQLQDDAIAIDAGVDAGAPEFDILGKPRLDEVDMGAYENQFVSNDNEVLLDNNGLLSISPNPVLGNTAVATLDAAWTGTIQLRLTNIFGQMVRYYEVEKTAGQLKYELNVANLGNGIYHLAASNGSQVVVTPLILN